MEIPGHGGLEGKKKKKLNGDFKHRAIWIVREASDERNYSPHSPPSPGVSRF